MRPRVSRRSVRVTRFLKGPAAARTTSPGASSGGPLGTHLPGPAFLGLWYTQKTVWPACGLTSSGAEPCRWCNPSEAKMHQVPRRSCHGPARAARGPAAAAPCEWLMGKGGPLPCQTRFCVAKMAPPGLSWTTRQLREAVVRDAPRRADNPIDGAHGRAIVSRCGQFVPYASGSPRLRAPLFPTAETKS